MSSPFDHTERRSIGRRAVLGTAAAAALTAVGVAGTSREARAADRSYTIDLSARTGALMYGASGWLYGLSDAGRPASSLISPLKPQYTCQKPPGGAQHPDGDAFNVASTFFNAGGKAVEIYMQDDYSQWPYQNLGINDYLGRVDAIVNKVRARSDRSRFQYTPFNEPDWIWYSNSGSGLTRFLNDWRTVFRRIRSLDPSARIVGPGFAAYNSAAYRSFLTFARDNNVLPQMISWHVLIDDQLNNWYNNYNNYRSIESSLGIGRIPIHINEYGRNNVDMGVPGRLVQYLTRFETSKVYGSLAFWSPPGTLCELLTPGGTARASAWYLYNWYANMTGQTVRVNLPSQTGALQSLASLSDDGRRVSIILGGVAGSTDIVLTGLSSTSLGSRVTVTISALANSGEAASNGPTVVHQGTGGWPGSQLIITVNGMAAANAYHVNVTAA